MDRNSERTESSEKKLDSVSVEPESNTQSTISEKEGQSAPDRPVQSQSVGEGVEKADGVGVKAGPCGLKTPENTEEVISSLAPQPSHTNPKTRRSLGL